MSKLISNFEKLIEAYGSSDRGFKSKFYDPLKMEAGNTYVVRIITPFTKDNIPFYFSAFHGAIKNVHPNNRIAPCKSVDNKTLSSGEFHDDCPICNFVKSYSFGSLMSSAPKELKKELFNLKLTPALQFLVTESSSPAEIKKLSLFGEEAVKSFINFWEGLNTKIHDHITDVLISIKVNKDWKNRYEFSLYGNKPSKLSQSEIESFKNELGGKEVKNILGFGEMSDQEMVLYLNKFIERIKRLSKLTGGQSLEDVVDEEESEDEKQFESRVKDKENKKKEEGIDFIEESGEDELSINDFLNSD